MRIAIIAILFLIAVPILGFGIRWATADIRGQLQAREEIFSGPSRIARYEEFFNLCNDVIAMKARRDVLEIGSNEWRGVNGILIGIVSDYNSRAGQADTSANFLASNLPYKISSEGLTICN